jgi:hypothetical protein
MAEATALRNLIKAHSFDLSSHLIYLHALASLRQFSLSTVIAH